MANACMGYGFMTEFMIMRKRIFLQIIALFFCFAVFSCGTGLDNIRRDPLWPDVDLSLYHSPLYYSNVKLAMATDYWEVRSIFDHSPVSAIGDKCSKALDRQACTTEFDAIRVDSGFGNAVCNPEIVYECKQYIVSNHGDSNRVWNTVDKLEEFLGTIDSKEEATSLASGHGFFTRWAVSAGGAGTNATNGQYWGAVAYARVAPSLHVHGGVREIDGEYELIVRKRISLCSPRQENRYLIRIKPSGDLVILREQINERNDDHRC
jgi:hypothetical protein